MKKYISIALAALLAVGLMAGCSANDDAQDTTPTPGTNDVTNTDDAGEDQPTDDPAATDGVEEVPEGTDEDAATGTYTDGTYTGEAQGFGGTITATVTVEGGKITAVELVGDAETAGIGSTAIEQLPEKIIEAQSTEVDGVAGATFSSDGVKAAVNNALGIGE